MIQHMPLDLFWPSNAHLRPLLMISGPILPKLTFQLGKKTRFCVFKWVRSNPFLGSGAESQDF